MNINLGGNTLTNGYFAGIVLGNGSRGRWTVQSANYIAVAGDMVQADTSNGPITITLPATASIGDTILIEDAKLTWNVNNLTITPNGLKLNGGTTNYTASVVGNKLKAIYISASYGWSVE